MRSEYSTSQKLGLDTDPLSPRAGLCSEPTLLLTLGLRGGGLPGGLGRELFLLDHSLPPHGPAGQRRGPRLGGRGDRRA